MRHYLYQLDYPSKDPTVAYAPDPLIVGMVKKMNKKE
jgi:hypothetical protein